MFVLKNVEQKNYIAVEFIFPHCKELVRKQIYYTKICF